MHSCVQPDWQEADGWFGEPEAVVHVLVMRCKECFMQQRQVRLRNAVLQCFGNLGTKPVSLWEAVLFQRG